MPSQCPHCGASLPIVLDAFCPNCRQPLDEQPSATTSCNESRPRPGVNFLGLMGMIGGLAAMTTGLFALIRENWAEAVYTGGIGLVITVISVGWLNRRKDKEGSN